MTRLTDNEIARLLDIAVNEKKSMLASRRDIADAQIAKLQQYYQKMAPEELKSKLISILEVAPHHIPPEIPASVYLTTQILTLTTAYWVEKIKAIESPYKGLGYPHNGFLRAIQEVIKVITDENGTKEDS